MGHVAKECPHATISIVQFLWVCVNLTYQLHIWCPNLCLHFGNVLDHHLNHNDMPVSFIQFFFRICPVDLSTWYLTSNTILTFSEFIESSYNILLFSRIYSEPDTHFLFFNSPFFWLVGAFCTPFFLLRPQLRPLFSLSLSLFFFPALFCCFAARSLASTLVVSDHHHHASLLFAYSLCFIVAGIVHHGSTVLDQSIRPAYCTRFTLFFLSVSIGWLLSSNEISTAT